MRHHLDDALPDPSGELGAKGDLGGFVTFPASVVGSTRGTKRESRLGHDEAALGDMSGDRVKRTEAAVPFGGSVENGHDVAFRDFLEADELREESRWKGVAPTAGGADEVSGRRWRKSRKY